jgi:capsule polysaccharide export protein KpsE/RkpR
VQNEPHMNHTAAASLPIDLSSVIVDRLRHIDNAGRAAIQWANSNFVAPTAGKFQKAAAHIQVLLLSNSAMRNITRYTSDRLETLIWLRGLKATIEESDDELAARVGELLPQIERLQATMETLRASIILLKGAIAGATKSSSLRAQRLAAFHRYLAVEADAYRALEAARWAVLEREADSDLTAGRIGETFTSAVELMASLGG